MSHAYEQCLCASVYVVCSLTFTMVMSSSLSVCVFSKVYYNVGRAPLVVRFGDVRFVSIAQ